jgi:hypothetical protein
VERFKWIDPAAVSMFAMAAFLIPFGILLTGALPIESAPIMMCWMFAWAIVLTINAVISSRNGDFIMGNLFLAFGALIGFGIASTLAVEFWSTTSGFGILPDTQLLGWVWLVLGIMIVAFAVSLGKMSGFFFGAVMLAGIGGLLYFVVLEGWIGLAGSVVDGIMWIVYGSCLVYAGVALLINGAFERVILPIGKPIFH